MVANAIKLATDLSFVTLLRRQRFFSFLRGGKKYSFSRNWWARRVIHFRFVHYGRSVIRKTLDAPMCDYQHENLNFQYLLHVDLWNTKSKWSWRALGTDNHYRNVWDCIDRVWNQGFFLENKKNRQKHKWYCHCNIR